MSLIVARCSPSDSGRLGTHLPEAVRSIMIDADVAVMLWTDSRGVKCQAAGLDDGAAQHR